VIDERLVRRLIDDQFPQWSQLPITAVVSGGNDNRTFRLGDELSVRLPSAERYAAQVEKEQRWLPTLAPQLPLPIPQPVARGAAARGYPYSWSVCRWLPGEPATRRSIGDLTEFATALASFLSALRRADTTDGPPPGAHNFYRGAPVSTYADETLRAIDALGNEIPHDRVLTVWDAAVAAPWHGEPVWFHGDVSADNLLVRNGELAAVIDFGTCGVGDPACDVVIAWTLLSRQSRDAFRARLGVDAATWTRGRGWAVWKALITLVGHLERDSSDAAAPRRVIESVLADGSDDG
jgi:aminoglycoside phosphotransferase (APT) family kinase protein